jgi:hypothetical protein
LAQTLGPEKLRDLPSGRKLIQWPIAARCHASEVALDLCYTDGSKSYVSVTVPGITEDVVIIIRSERGWQMRPRSLS